MSSSSSSSSSSRVSAEQEAKFIENDAHQYEIYKYQQSILDSTTRRFQCLAALPDIRTGPSVQCKQEATHGHLCTQHAKDLLGVEVRESTIRGAGLGLFATRPFKKKEMICEYAPNALPFSIRQYRIPVFSLYYIRSDDEKQGIDAWDPHSGFGRYINDLDYVSPPPSSSSSSSSSRSAASSAVSAPTRKKRRARKSTLTMKKSKRKVKKEEEEEEEKETNNNVRKRNNVNAKVDNDDAPFRPWMFATRDIDEGEELGYDYGGESYWKQHLDNMKILEKLKAQEDAKRRGVQVEEEDEDDDEDEDEDGDDEEDDEEEDDEDEEDDENDEEDDEDDEEETEEEESDTDPTLEVDLDDDEGPKHKQKQQRLRSYFARFRLS